jgi:hypothetical protein
MDAINGLGNCCFLVILLALAWVVFSAIFGGDRTQ